MPMVRMKIISWSIMNTPKVVRDMLAIIEALGEWREKEVLSPLNSCNNQECTIDSGPRYTLKETKEIWEYEAAIIERTSLLTVGCQCEMLLRTSLGRCEIGVTSPGLAVSRSAFMVIWRITNHVAQIKSKAIGTCQAQDDRRFYASIIPAFYNTPALYNTQRRSDG
jgi:hypothetical protein